MTIRLLFIVGVVAMLSIFLACTNQPVGTTTQELSKDSLIKRGEYLITIIGCEDCHSPKAMSPNGPQPIPGHRLGGYMAGNPLPPADTTAGKRGWVWMTMDLTATKGPWGTSYAANISSDSTGIGAWNEQQFTTAMRKGKSKGLEGGRMLLPPMPWTDYMHLSDNDLKAIYTYLKNTTPVKNVVPEPQKPV